MKWFKKLSISLAIAFFGIACGAVLLFNWNALGWKALSVPTGSMRPTIPPGSLVLMHSVPTPSLKVGDVITYANLLKPGTTITHRIVKTYKLGGTIPAFVTKGDANPTADTPIVGGLVKGKAVWHVPYLGRAMMWSKTWTGIAVLVYVPALLIMFEEVWRLNLYYRTSKAYKSVLVMAREARNRRSRLVPASAVSLAAVIIPALIAFPVSALLRSNTVSLAPNSITTAVITTPPPQCPGNGTNISITGNGSSTVNVNNSNNQNANSGNANSNGGTATSGNASNTNCTNITITIH